MNRIGVAHSLLVTVTIAAAGTIACASEASQRAATESHGVSDAELDELRREIEARLPHASALQQELLLDGLITRGDADRAAADTVLCAREQGVTVVADWDAVTKSMAFRTRNDSENSKPTFDACWADRFQLVAESLAIQAALSPEEASRLAADMVDCLAGAGVDIRRWPDDVPNEPRALQAESTCYEEAVRAVGG